MSGLGELPTVPALASRRTTPDYIAEILRDSILTGQLADGEELNQVALAQHFDVSRVPIREALRQLQAEGLVRQEAHRRAVVTTLSRERVMELFDLRVRLEPYLLEKALPQLGDETIDGLEELLERMEATRDHHAWLGLNRVFHQALYQPSDALLTLELVDNVMTRTTRYLYRASGGIGVRRVDEAQREHRAILEATRRGDLGRMLRTLERHIEGTRRRVEALFDTIEDVPQQTEGEA